MAATLTHLTQRTLSAYTFIDCDHSLWQAWSDYQVARAQRDGVQPAKRRLRRELRLEHMTNEIIEHAA
jgi:hypothetical protein